MLEIVATNKPSGISVLLLKVIKNQTLQIGWDENNKMWQKNSKLSMLNSHGDEQLNKRKNCVNRVNQ